MEENYSDLGCSFGGGYVYAMGFAASVYLLEQLEQTKEDSFVNYWSLLNVRQTWQQAFEGAFGIGIDDFYRGFSEWLPAQLPPPDVTLRLQVRWPDMDDSQLQAGSFLYARNEERTDPGDIPFRSASTGWFGYSEVPTLILEYREGVGRDSVCVPLVVPPGRHLYELPPRLVQGWRTDQSTRGRHGG